MATAIHPSPSQQPVNDANTTNVDLISNFTNIIREMTGNPPTNADHVYNLIQYVKDYPHPCPTVIENTGGTLPTASPCQPIAENLQGWEDVSSQDLNYVRAIFDHVPERDQSLAYDHFFRALGRAPRVQEFSRFLLIFEGNDLTDSSRKTLGQLYLENEEFRETLNRHLRTIDLLQQMLSSKEAMIQVLGESNDKNKKEVDTLQNQKRNLESIIRSIQLKKADLQLEYNALKRRHDQHLAELEDEREDKQQLQADKHALVHTITAHEHNIDTLRDTVKDLGQRLHKESKDKTAILKELSEKSKLVSELEEDREILMMENEAQGKYFIDLKEEMMHLQKENEELKESIYVCKTILAKQYDKLEKSFCELSKNFTQMTENNDRLTETVADLENKTVLQSERISTLHSMTEQQSVTIFDLERKNSDLESKNSDLESKNSDLESMTEQQSVTISDLESKNSDLESMTEQQSVTISDLESKNSDLESMTEQQSVTISDLESKNSDLESMTEQQSVTITALETKLQQQNQRQQYFILFLAAVIFAMVCLQLLSQGINHPSIS